MAVLITEFEPIVESYGSDSPARGILLSVYLAILVVSTWLLIFKRDPMLVAPLLLVQVIYKLTTPFTVRSFSNPVVVSNIFFAGLHLVTLRFIHKKIIFPTS